MPQASDPRDERIAELQRENEALRRQLAELARRIKELEERLRRSKRQATPFACDRLVEIRRKPGRGQGHAGAWQAVRERVDEELFAPLCGARLSESTMRSAAETTAAVAADSRMSGRAIRSGTNAR